MPVLLDTGILYAYYDRRDDWHKRSADLIQQETEGLILPAPVIPEVDYLLGRRLGADAQAVFYQGLSEQHFLIAELGRDGYERVAEINRQFASLRLGFVDAAIFAIAEALKLRHIATTDRRDFGPVAAHLGMSLLP